MLDFLLKFLEWLGQLRRISATMHKASFEGTEPLVKAYFFTITNLSKCEIEVTHVWMECRGEDIDADQPERPLPKRLKPDESWGTWIEFNKLPEWIHADPTHHGRVRLSTGKIIKTKQAKKIPSRGSVPGGSIRPEYANSHPHNVSSEAEATSSEQQEQQTTETYDVMQVCENGHKITGCFDTKPERRKDFCDRCGEKTITACPNCDKEIQGDRIKELHDGSWLQDKRVNTPSYCPNCGEPYPWTTRKRRKEESIQAFLESGKLDEEEKKTVGEDIENISKNIPDTEPSAIRIKKIWKKYGPIAYEAIMEFASRTAAKILKGP